MGVVIETKNRSKVYAGVPAVDRASFSVKKGEVVGFVGLNGAGKSTTINMLMGFIRPSEGSVALFGEELTLPGAASSHQRIGFATGDMSLFDSMTGRQYHEFIARAYGVGSQSVVYQHLVDTFDPQLDKKISTLSRGNRQKIALIAAFMTEPELVILDEPSSGLDPLMQQHFLDLVREQAKKGTTIFMSSHYLNEVVDVCTRILLIKNGKLVKDIPASELEATSGKLVRVVTGKKVAPPASAEVVEREKHGHDYTLQFIYKDSPAVLHAWLGSLVDVKDMTINDHSVEAAFDDLYDVKEAEDA